jgi:hypothetical protein
LLKSSPFAATDYYLALGKAYQYNQKFDQAISAYQSYLKGLNWFAKRDAAPKVNQYIAQCEFSKAWLMIHCRYLLLTGAVNKYLLR